MISEVDEHNQQIQQKIEVENGRLKKLEQELQQSHLLKGLETLPEVIRADVKTTFETDDNEHNEVQRYLYDKFKATLELNEDALAKQKPYADLKKAVEDQVKTLNNQKRSVPTIRALWDRGEPSPTYIYVRGDHTQSGDCRPRRNLAY